MPVPRRNSVSPGNGRPATPKLGNCRAARRLRFRDRRIDPPKTPSPWPSAIRDNGPRVAIVAPACYHFRRNPLLCTTLPGLRTGVHRCAPAVGCFRACGERTRMPWLDRSRCRYSDTECSPAIKGARHRYGDSLPCLPLPWRPVAIGGPRPHSGCPLSGRKTSILSEGLQPPSGTASSDRTAALSEGCRDSRLAPDDRPERRKTIHARPEHSIDGPEYRSPGIPHARWNHSRATACPPPYVLPATRRRQTATRSGRHAETRLPPYGTAPRHASSTPAWRLRHRRPMPWGWCAAPLGTPADSRRPPVVHPRPVASSEAWRNPPFPSATRAAHCPTPPIREACRPVSLPFPRAALPWYRTRLRTRPQKRQRRDLHIGRRHTDCSQYAEPRRRSRLPSPSS